MGSQKHLTAYSRSQLPPWKFLSGDCIELDGINTAAATIPTEASIVEIRAEAGEVYFNINGLASATTGGYIPEDQAEIIGPLANLNSLDFYSTTASTMVHLFYFVEV